MRGAGLCPVRKLKDPVLNLMLLERPLVARRGRSCRWARIPCARRSLTPVNSGRLFPEPRPEGPNIRGLSPLLRANECIAAPRRQGEVEGHHQTPGAQIVVGEGMGSEQHAGAFDRRVQRVIGAAEFEGRD